MVKETIEILDSDEKVIFSGTVKELIDSYSYEVSERGRLEIECNNLETDHDIIEEQYWELNKQLEQYKQLCDWLDSSYWNLCLEYDKLNQKFLKEKYPTL